MTTDLRQTLMARGFRDAALLNAICRVDRRDFVEPRFHDRAYRDESIDIGHGQRLGTMLLTAQLLGLAGVKPGLRVLEIGTGSGYSAAVLAELGARVFTIERIEALARSARHRLEAWPSVRVRCGDGRRGWSEVAPFDAIVVGGATQYLADCWLDQLTTGGRLVAAIGDDTHQELVVLTRTARGFERKGAGPVFLTALTP